MHDYAFDVELVRLAILLGVVVSMLLYEKYGVTTGGAIVPGYLALFVIRPSQIVVTLLIAVLTHRIVHRHLRPRLMLWGRHLFETEILVALVLQMVWSGLLFLFTPFVPQVDIIRGIGFLLPGIIAHDMGRQGTWTTIGTASISALVVFGLITLIGAVRDILGLAVPLEEMLRGAQPDAYAFPTNWLWIAIVVSVLSNIALYHRGWFQRVLLPDSIRAGGFVTAGYLALFVARPADLLFVLVCSSMTYLIVTYYLMKQAILFGRSKMATMFVTGMVVTWATEILLSLSGLYYIPWVGFNAITPTVVALLANDAQRQGPPRTLIGAGASTLIVFAAVSVLNFGYSVLISDGSALAFVR